jgi:Flp pilus assembly protein TadG
MRPVSCQPATGRDRGSATAELAVALPALVILLLSGVLAIAAVTNKLGCVAAARDAALASSRGESVSTPGASLSREDSTVIVTVVRPPVTCQAVAAMEPGQ